MKFLYVEISNETVSYYYGNQPNNTPVTMQCQLLFTLCCSISKIQQRFHVNRLVWNRLADIWEPRLSPAVMLIGTSPSCYLWLRFRRGTPIPPINIDLFIAFKWPLTNFIRAIFSSEMPSTTLCLPALCNISKTVFKCSCRVLYLLWQLNTPLVITVVISSPTY